MGGGSLGVVGVTGSWAALGGSSPLRIKMSKTSSTSWDLMETRGFEEEEEEEDDELVVDGPAGCC